MMFSLIVAIGFFSAQQYPGSQPDGSRLAAILKKAEGYCRRLENAALDFVCLEEVTERTRHFTPTTDVYLYDYQYVRKNQEMKEERKLVSVNGKKEDIRDSPLQTVEFRYENVLFGPVGLLSQSWQAYHDFRLVGEDTLGKEKTVVIEAIPKPEFHKPHCYGRIWVREKDDTVLKIVWDQKSIENFRSVEEWAKAHEAEPRITAFSEYGLEKNGLRFPTRNYTENAFVGKDGHKTVFAEVDTLYRGYKFFTVETEIVLK
ncbi:MAG: hypothetical protein ABR951_05075 [Candidatus Aminicenantales bacterium]|jgi:hypothetical protein